MKSQSKAALWITTIAIVSSVHLAFAEKVARDPELVKQRFAQLASRLDKGGDLMLIANIEGLLKEYVDQMLALSSMGFAASGASPTNNPFTKVSPFLEKSGLYAAEGFGMSLRPREDGLNDVKIFLTRDPDAAGRPIWRASVGFKPRRLDGLDYLPGDSVLAQTSAGEFGQLWKLIRQGVRELGSPDMSAGFDTWLETMSTELGVGLDDLMASIGNETFFAILLSPDETTTLPMGMPGQEITIPAPSFVVGVAVKTDQLASAVEHQFTKKGTALTESSAGGVKLKSAELPGSMPIFAQPTFTTHKGMFLFGSNPGVVSAAIAAAEKKNGLVTTAQFKKLFGDLSMENNGLSYVSPRFGKVLEEIQSKSAAGLPHMMSMGMMVPMMNNMNSAFAKRTSATVTFNRKSGILTKGVTSSGVKDMISSMSMGPMFMMMATVGIPSFINARSMSQQHGCINNLRILDAAKEQWAMEQNKKDGDSVEKDGMLQYVKGATMPVCPQGGKYTVNAIGADPACNIPGHTL